MRFDSKGAIEESAAQKRFMNTALGHQPGSQYRGLEALHDMITKGKGKCFISEFLIPAPVLYVDSV